MSTYLRKERGGWRERERESKGERVSWCFLFSLFFVCVSSAPCAELNGPNGNGMRNLEIIAAY